MTNWPRAGLRKGDVAARRVDGSGPYGVLLNPGPDCAPTVVGIRAVDLERRHFVALQGPRAKGVEENTDTAEPERQGDPSHEPEIDSPPAWRCGIDITQCIE
jgi:hypothetical protein